MKAIGLTGGVGMGKSTCADFLRRRGIPVIDTDDLARSVVEPGQPALEEILRVFGAQMIGPDGRLRRGELARRVFADPTLRSRLEGILHPRIRELWQRQMAAWRGEGRAMAVVVIPLLFETHAERELDATICVACTAGTQRERLAERRWSPQQIDQRIAAQLPVEQKISRSDFVIWNEAALDVHDAQLDRILAEVR